ncbi:MAG: LacI family DNA-binding transcriptional regulator [Lentisphaeria bacterium]|nr:LacI family DNA-binding transcriptional regulator [Lentisphaeria bacterium]
MTQQEIARRLNVSQAAVSMVMSDPHTNRVSLPKRMRILALLKSGAHMNQRGRKKTWNILCVREAFEQDNSSLYSEYFNRAYAGIEPVVSAHSYNILLESYTSGTSLQAVSKQKIDAVIWIAKTASDEIAQVVGGYPTVLLNFIPEQFCFDMVGADNTGSVKLALEHLHALGHERIAYLSGAAPTNCPDPDLSSEERHVAFLSGCRALRLQPHPSWVSHEPFAESSKQATLEHFRRIFACWRSFNPAPSAVLCSNDYYASVLYHLCLEQNIAVPRDLSIVGIDNLSSSSFFNLQLSSVDMNIKEMGKIAAELLFQRMKNPDAPCQRIVCQSVLKLKHSTAAYCSDKNGLAPKVPRRNATSKTARTECRTCKAGETA